MIAEPLFVTGAIHVTLAAPLPGDAETALGAVGAPTVAGGDAPDVGPIPRAFLAATVNLYVVPFFNPVTLPVLAVDAKVVDVCAA